MRTSMNIAAGRSRRVKGLAAALGMLTVMASLPASGQTDLKEIKFAKTADPVQHSFAGVSLDVHGVHLGMPLREADPQIRKSLPQGEVLTSDKNATLDYKGLLATSQSYVSGLNVQVGNLLTEQVILDFGTEATGAPLVRLLQARHFRKAASRPSREEMLEEARRAFGKESRHDDYSQSDAPKVSAFWIFDGRGRNICDENCTDEPSGSASVTETDELQVEYNQGFRVLVSLRLDLVKGDLTRVKDSYLSMEDVENELLNAAETRKQLMAAVDALQSPGGAVKP